MKRSDLSRCHRVVVKVGTSTITHPNGTLNLVRMERLARTLADLINQGMDVILVSSGSVGAGMGRMGVHEKPVDLPMKQALAAVGQGLLMQVYEKLFNEYGVMPAQVLLTRHSFSERGRYLNVCNTLRRLLELKVVPIVNENDTVAVDEIKFGDNDTLSALVACAVEADLLVILSDIDGLYTADPRIEPSAQLIAEVHEISENIRSSSGSKGSTASSGGMFTKLLAADMVLPAGIPLVIASGSEDLVIHRILSGEEVGTLFVPPLTKRQARKHWIAWGDRPQGTLMVDDGAAQALCERGSSLLPRGILKVEGDFKRGRIVAVADSQGTVIARGLANYDSRELRQICGHHCDEIASILGVKDYDEVIHRDNMVLSSTGKEPS